MGKALLVSSPLSPGLTINQSPCSQGACIQRRTGLRSLLTPGRQAPSHLSFTEGKLRLWKASEMPMWVLHQDKPGGQVPLSLHPSAIPVRGPCGARPTPTRLPYLGRDCAQPCADNPSYIPEYSRRDHLFLPPPPPRASPGSPAPALTRRPHQPCRQVRAAGESAGVN